MRRNVVTWVDGKVLTKYMNELQVELMEWQKFAYDVQFNGAQPFGGDSSVIVAAINLRNMLDKIITKSNEENAK